MNSGLTNSQAVLFRLIRIALGWDQDYSIPLGVDWNEVIILAEQQGVLPIITDGYEVYLKHNPNAESFLSKKKEDDGYASVLSSILITENDYDHHRKVLGILSEVLNKEHIPFIVMKGLSCGKYYPLPHHRPCGDIDIYTREAFEESNQALEKSGFHVEPHYYRHHVALIKGVTIENHRILCDLRGPKKQTAELETLLKKLANKSIVDGEDYGKGFPGAHYPIADFNALFLPWHVSAHFEFERVTLRHLLDWALFLSHEGNNINISEYLVYKRKFTYGLGPFADILTDLSIRYLGLPKETIPVELVIDAENCDKDLSDKVLNRIFEDTEPASDNNVWKERWKLFKYVLKDDWKYRSLYGMSPIRFILYKLKGVIFRIGENN